MTVDRPEHQRVVITGVGLTAPNGNSLPEFRRSLLEGRSGVVNYAAGAMAMYPAIVYVTLRNSGDLVEEDSTEK